MQEELELIHKAAEGDCDAFEQLVMTYQKQVYNLTLRMAGNPEDALDLSQEAFFKAWRGLSTYRFDSAFSTWLYRLTSNVCIDFLRKQKKSKVVSLNFVDDENEEQELTLPDPGPSTEDQVLLQLDQEQIAQAMNRLEPEYRQVLVMRVVNGLSYTEISEALALKEGTVKSRIARARDKMRIFLQKSGNKSDPPSSKKAGRGTDAP